MVAEQKYVITTLCRKVERYNWYAHRVETPHPTGNKPELDEQKSSQMVIPA